MIQMDTNSKCFKEGEWGKKRQNRQDDGKKKRMQMEQTEVVKLKTFSIW